MKFCNAVSKLLFCLVYFLLLLLVLSLTWLRWHGASLFQVTMSKYPYPLWVYNLTYLFLGALMCLFIFVGDIHNLMFFFAFLVCFFMGLIALYAVVTY